MHARARANATDKIRQNPERRTRREMDSGGSRTSRPLCRAAIRSNRFEPAIVSDDEGRFQRAKNAGIARSRRKITRVTSFIYTIVDVHARTQPRNFGKAQTYASLDDDERISRLFFFFLSGRTAIGAQSCRDNDFGRR